MEKTFSTQNLAVGYDRNILIQDINIHLEQGKILTLIGPNGAGKSTVLKTITRQLSKISGNIFIGDQSFSEIPMRNFAKMTAVVLTERIDPEMMTCSEVVAMGRYPYTDILGKLTARDKEIVKGSLARVHASDLADREFTALSDGQRQRIMLARAICQEPDIIVLDEPTAYLDIRYKIELLNILREMSRERGTIVIMSLHEIDLAMKISDELLCLDGEKITAYGKPDEILSSRSIADLYAINTGSYDLMFGSVEFPAPQGKPQVFVLGANGKGTPVYRELQKRGIPFATGILFENDIDTRTADALAAAVIKAPAFEPISRDLVIKASDLVQDCGCILDPGIEIGTLNKADSELLRIAGEHHLRVIHDIKEL